jgi:hypothetical protein
MKNNSIIIKGINVKDINKKAHQKFIIQVNIIVIKV